MSTTTFDAAAYKRTTELQWDEAAAAWHRWGPLLERWLGPATETMLRMARIEEGSRVLDVAAGTGGQTIAAARRVGSGGRVLATDISEGILRYAAAEAAHHGLTNVECRRADGEALDVAEGTFDAVISRLGLIYLPDRGRALAGMKRALRPGGRLAAIVYGAPERNQFFRRRSGSSAAALASARLRRDSQARSVSDRLAPSSTRSPPPAFTTSRRASWTRPSACRVQPSASASSGSRSAPCIR